MEVLARGPEMWKEAGRDRELRARIGRRKDKGVEKKWEVFLKKERGDSHPDTIAELVS